MINLDKIYFYSSEIYRSMAINHKRFLCMNLITCFCCKINMQYQLGNAPNPPSVNSTKSSSTGSYKNFACILNGTFVRLMSNLYKKCTSITLDYIKAKYLPIQLLGPAENGMNE